MRTLAAVLLMSAVSAHLTVEPEDGAVQPKQPQRIFELPPIDKKPELAERSSDDKPIEPLVLCEKLWKESGFRIRQYVPKSQAERC